MNGLEIYAYIEGTSTTNQRIESFWGHLRKQCIQFWIELFHDLQNTGDCTGDFLDKQLLMFCFLGMIQVSYTYTHHSQKKVLMHS